MCCMKLTKCIKICEVFKEVHQQVVLVSEINTPVEYQTKIDSYVIQIACIAF